MWAGKLDRWVTLLKRETTTNDFNEEVEAFYVAARVWASKEDISDAEKVRAQQVGATITTRFRVREDDRLNDINPTWRLLLEERGQDREYDITGVKEIGRGEGWEITATARADRKTLYSEE